MVDLTDRIIDGGLSEEDIKSELINLGIDKAIDFTAGRAKIVEDIAEVVRGTGNGSKAEKLLEKLNNAPNRTVSFDPKQIQKKYTKHAADFGVTGNYNKGNAEKFQSAVDAHIKSADVKPIT